MIPFIKNLEAGTFTLWCQRVNVPALVAEPDWHPGAWNLLMWSAQVSLWGRECVGTVKGEGGESQQRPHAPALACPHWWKSLFEAKCSEIESSVFFPTSTLFK